jgi:hypothetical protein
VLSKRKKRPKSPLGLETGDMAETTEHLLCNCKALSSNPSLTKNKKGIPE